MTWEEYKRARLALNLCYACELLAVLRVDGWRNKLQNLNMEIANGTRAGMTLEDLTPLLEEQIKLARRVQAGTNSPEFFEEQLNTLNEAFPTLKSKDFDRMIECIELMKRPGFTPPPEPRGLSIAELNAE